MPPVRHEPKTWIKSITALFILKTLRQTSAYGNQIADHIKQRTFGGLRPNPNFLYPLLRDMEEDGLVAGTRENPAKRGRRVYTITARGLAYLEELNEPVRDKFLAIERKQAAIRQYLFEE
ncbi:MAG TPA: PadR family transcriptional regulator [Selenomonadales bacterium]|nr:PadR family transcriptional regulator [Selenomonadales bacterium]